MAVKLKPNPTFRAKVDIPVAGGEPLVIEFEFKHMTRSQLIDWGLNGKPGRTNDDAMMEIASNWFDVEEAFSPESVTQLFENYQAAPIAIFDVYAKQLRLGREKN